MQENKKLNNITYYKINRAVKDLIKMSYWILAQG